MSQKIAAVDLDDPQSLPVAALTQKI